MYRQINFFRIIPFSRVEIRNKVPFLTASGYFSWILSSEVLIVTDLDICSITWMFYLYKLLQNFSSWGFLGSKEHYDLSWNMGSTQGFVCEVKASTINLSILFNLATLVGWEKLVLKGSRTSSNAYLWIWPGSRHSYIFSPSATTLLA